MSDIAERVKKIVIEHLGVDAEKVTENASFIDDLGSDSLDVVEIAMAIEHDLGIEAMPDTELQAVRTLQQLIDVVARHAPAGVVA